MDDPGVARVKLMVPLWTPLDLALATQVVAGNMADDPYAKASDLAVCLFVEVLFAGPDGDL
jgi:hypothetical protein